MKIFLTSLIYFVLYAMNALVGAWFIGDAISHFKAKRYYVFGFIMMLIIFPATNIVLLLLY